MTQKTQTINGLEFTKLIKNILSMLSEKEQDVIERRFALSKATKKETLDRIGKSYSITRERVRQIEEVALQKLVRIAKDPFMKKIHDIAYELLQANGGVMADYVIVEEVLKKMDHVNKTSANQVRFTMRVSTELKKQEKNQFVNAYWYLASVEKTEIHKTMKLIQKVLRKNKEVMSLKELTAELPEIEEARIVSLLLVDKEFMQVPNGKWGLVSWRHINPRSIKDCIMIIFNKTERPMHFREIKEQVAKNFSDRKVVTAQASHNELIRHKDFVLLGRGIYGLAKWGMSAGTVCDLIVSVMKDKKVMSRQDIINGVLKKREVRIGTISLNLQKYDFFKRVGRAVYEYKPELDNRSRTKYSELA